MPTARRIHRLARRSLGSAGGSRRRLAIEALEARTLLAADTLPTFVPGELLVGLEVGGAHGASHQVIERAARQLSGLGLSQGKVLLDSAGGSAHARMITRWTLAGDSDVLDVAKKVAALGGVAYAEPNFVWSTADLPNDPQFGDLWGLDNTGQGGGTADADIDAPEAWERWGTGSREVIVGVIDTGVDYNHPDLAANIWSNPGEVPGNNIDDDGNGYVDDIHGINAITGSGDPLDDQYHGTHVSGTIGAMGNNGVGVVGVSQQVTIAACKFLNSSGSGTTDDAIECFQYFNKLKLAGQNIVITNNSWGGGAFSEALADAMAGPANMEPILHVVAAGNANSNNDFTPVYPAGYALPNIVSVAATDRTDRYSSFSNYGLTTVDLAAPGSSILSTMPGNGYGLLSGTSMATPHVAGAAALVASVYPDYSAIQLKQSLMDGTEIVGGIGANAGKPTVTDGRLNLAQTLDNQGEVDTTAPSPVTTLGVVQMGLMTATVSWLASGDDGDLGQARVYDLRYSKTPITQANWAQATRAAGEPRPVAAGELQTAKFKGLERGTTYYFGLKVRDNLGNESGLSNIASATTALGTSVLSDGFEAGLGNWTAESPWGRSSSVRNSGTFSATDSPSGNYANNVNASLTSLNIDLSGYHETQLSFYHRYDLEQGYDFGRVEVSINGGVSWATLASYTGTASSFGKVVVDLGPYDGRSSLLVRFRLQSDGSIRRDGWYIDDVSLVALEAPGFRVTPTTGLVTTEAGGTASFTIALLSDVPPTADVTVPIRSSRTTEGVVNQDSVTFSPANWQTPQTLTITGVADGVFDNSMGYTIFTDPAVSADNRFSGLNPQDVSVTNLNIDPDPNTKFYVVNDRPTTSVSNMTYEYNKDGALVESYSTSGSNARGVTTNFAGDRVWVVQMTPQVIVHNNSGSFLGQWNAGNFLNTQYDLQGLATDGTDMWILDAKSDKVFRYENGAIITSGTLNPASSFSLANANSNPTDLVLDGTHFWVVDNGQKADKVFKYTLAGSLVGSWTLSGGGGSPTGITVDPSNPGSPLWIVDNATDRVYQFARPVSGSSVGVVSSFPLAAGNTNPQGIADPPPTMVAADVNNGSAAYDAALFDVLNELSDLIQPKNKRRS